MGLSPDLAVRRYSKLGGILQTGSARTLGGILLGWYLVVPDGDAWHQIGAYDTAKECREAIVERAKSIEQQREKLETQINKRQAAGERIGERDLQWIAYRAAAEATFRIALARCQIAQ